MRTRRTVALLTVALCLSGLAACASDGDDPVTFEGYLSALEAICTEITTQLDALPSPPDRISVTDFATSAASRLDNEAVRIGELVVPDGDDVTLDDLDGEHRAFIRNTEEQAAAWRQVAATGADGDLTTTTNLIAQLVAGRNELATELGAPACARGGL